MKNQQKAISHLKKDPILAPVIETWGDLEWDDRSDLFLALIRSINGQQLSVKAAASIFGRLKELLNNDITPNNLLSVTDEQLRICGISYSKIKYMKGIATAVIEKQIDLEYIKTLSDEDVIAELTKLHGIGRWSAEMLLIFSLRRPDVFSLGDLGLREAVKRLYNVPREDLKAIETIADQWRPYRSYACRYLWLSLKNTPN